MEILIDTVVVDTGDRTKTGMGKDGKLVLAVSHPGAIVMRVVPDMGAPWEVTLKIDAVDMAYATKTLAELALYGVEVTHEFAEPRHEMDVDR